MHGNARRSLIIAAVAFVCGAGSSAQADDTLWINPGIRVSYAFGDGFSLGAELSVGVVPDVAGTDIGALLKRGVFIGYGFAASYDFNFGSDTGKFHVGAEWIGPAIGLQVGPSVVHDAEGPHFGFTINPWVGTYAIPFYAYTIVVGRENISELGVNLKLHLCVSGEDACGSSDGDVFDD